MKAPSTRYSLRTLLGILVAACLVSAAIAFWLKSRLGPTHPVVKHHGKTVAEVLEELGPPASDTTFPMSKAYGEFRVGLLNVYPDVSGVHADVMIRECTWDQGWHRLTLWFHKEGDEWRVLDSCRWHKDLQF